MLVGLFVSLGRIAKLKILLTLQNLFCEHLANLQIFSNFSGLLSTGITSTNLFLTLSILVHNRREGESESVVLGVDQILLAGNCAPGVHAAEAHLDQVADDAGAPELTVVLMHQRNPFTAVTPLSARKVHRLPGERRGRSALAM